MNWGSQGEKKDKDAESLARAEHALRSLTWDYDLNSTSDILD